MNQSLDQTWNVSRQSSSHILQTSPEDVLVSQPQDHGGHDNSAAESNVFSPSGSRRGTKFPAILTVVMLILGLAFPALAAEVKSVDNTTKSIRGDAPKLEPWFMRNTDIRYVAYAIYVETIDGTNDSPLFTITGSKGTSKEITLKKNAETLTGGYDYFIFNGQELGDVGIPMAITFKQQGGDTWAFRNIEIEYLITPEANTTWFKPQQAVDWFAQFKDHFKSRDAVGKHLGGIQHWEELTVDKIEFPSQLGIAESADQGSGINYEEEQTSYAKGSALAAHRGGSEVKISLSDELIVIDARSAPGNLPWKSSQKQSVSEEEIKEAMRSQQKETGWENTVTVGVKATVATKAPLQKSAEFSVENKFAVHENNVRASEDKATQAMKTEYGTTNEQEYFVKPGQVAFLKLSRTATVSQFSDFSKLRRISPSVSVNYSLTMRYYERIKADGRLYLLMASSKAGQANSDVRDYTYGPALDASSEAKYLKAAEDAFAGFNPRSPVADSPMAGPGMVSQLQGSRWTYQFGESTFEFEFGADSIENFSNGWWPGVTWQANGDNQAILTNSPTAEASALPPGPAAVGKKMTIKFNSADSYTGTDFDGNTAVSGRRIR